MVKKITKLLFIFTASFPVLFFLNTGFSTDLLWKTFQTIVFSVLFSLSLVWPVLKKYFGKHFKQLYFLFYLVCLWSGLF